MQASQSYWNHLGLPTIVGKSKTKTSKSIKARKDMEQAQWLEGEIFVASGKRNRTYLKQ